MPPYRVSVRIEVDAGDLRPRVLAALARKALAAESALAPADLSVVLADDRTLRRLNRRFRDRDTPTDVLSFGLNSGPEFVTPDGGRQQIGEVVISIDTARRQAKRAGHTLDDELAHLLVHGVLHLLGYDHERPADERAMRAREEALLGRPAH